MGEGYTPVSDKIERALSYELQQKLRDSKEFNHLLQEVTEDALIPLYSALNDLWNASGAFNKWQFSFTHKAPGLKQWREGRNLWGSVSRAMHAIHDAMSRQVDNPEGKQLYDAVEARRDKKIATLKQEKEKEEARRKR